MPRRSSSSAGKHKGSTGGGKSPPSSELHQTLSALSTQYLSRGWPGRAALCLAAAAQHAPSPAAQGGTRLELAAILRSHGTDSVPIRRQLEQAASVLADSADPRRFEAAVQLGRLAATGAGPTGAADDPLPVLAAALASLPHGDQAAITSLDESTEVRWAYCAAFLHAEIEADRGDLEAALATISTAIAFATTAGTGHEHTRLMLELTRAMYLLRAGDTDGAGAALDAVDSRGDEFHPQGDGDSEVHARSMVHIFCTTLRVLLLLAQYKVSESRKVMQQLHLQMKDYNPARLTAPIAGVFFEWMPRKQLFVLVYLASVIVQTATGDTSHSKSYIKNALDLVKKQQQAVDPERPLIAAAQAKGYQAFHLMLLEQAALLQLGSMHLESFHETMKVGLHIVASEPKLRHQHAETLRLIVGMYCEATDEMDRARSLLAAPMSSKSTVSEQMAAQLGLAFLASRAEGIDDGPAAALAGIASSAQALAASAKAPLRTGASGLVQAVAAMARGAHADGVAILEKALHRLNKSIGKKAYAIALMLMGECLCGGDIDTTNTSVANEQDILKAFEMAFEAAGKMGDLRLRQCAGRMLLARMLASTPPASPAEQAKVADAIATAEGAALEAIAKVKVTAAHEELCSNALIWRRDPTR